MEIYEILSQLMEERNYLRLQYQKGKTLLWLGIGATFHLSNKLSVKCIPRLWKMN